MNDKRTWMSRAAIMLCVAAIGLSACGGGGDAGSGPFAGVGSGGTGSFANGPITGQGSIVVGGIHFEQNNALVTDAEGGKLTPADLKLGMVVELDASSVANRNGQPRADALNIKVMKALLGKVDVVTADTLTVMGQTVRVTDATRFSDDLANKLQSLSVGDVVDVYGFHDANEDVFVATRIDRKATTVTSYVVRGVIQDLDLVNGRCRIGNQLISYTWAPTTPDLANGSVATAKLKMAPTTPQGGGAPVWYAEQMTLNTPNASNVDDAYVDGLVTAKDAATPGVFSVNGIKVDARQAACSPTCAQFQIGDHVNVHGRLVAKDVVATQVTRPGVD